MNITDQGYSNTDEEIASRAEPNVSNYLYDTLSPQTKREVHKYAKAVR
jgi:hypothetical protein